MMMGPYTAVEKNDTTTTTTTSKKIEKPSLFQRIRSNRAVQGILRVFQLLSAAISLGLFSARLYRIVRTIQHARAATGAVEGILAAAVAYLLISMLIKFILKSGAPKWVRWVWIVFDLGFVGGFIAVAVLTSPAEDETSTVCRLSRAAGVEPDYFNCNLPWGTFGLAIFSAVLHTLTAIFNDPFHSDKEQKQDYELTATDC